jgi:hypothetical protein
MRAAALLGTLVVLAIAPPGHAEPSEAGACATIASVVNACVGIVVRGEAQPCFAAPEGSPASLDCPVLFTWTVTGSSSPLKAAVGWEHGGDGDACPTNPTCQVDGNLTQDVFLDPGQGQDASISIHAYARQPILEVDTEAGATVHVAA